MTHSRAGRDVFVAVAVLWLIVRSCPRVMGSWVAGGSRVQCRCWQLGVRTETVLLMAFVT